MLTDEQCEEVAATARAHLHRTGAMARLVITDTATPGMPTWSSDMLVACMEDADALYRWAERAERALYPFGPAPRP